MYICVPAVRTRITYVDHSEYQYPMHLLGFFVRATIYRCDPTQQKRVCPNAFALFPPISATCNCAARTITGARIPSIPFGPRALQVSTERFLRWWRSWAVSGSPAIYVFVYGIYQYHNLHSKHQPDAISSFVVYSCVQAPAPFVSTHQRRCFAFSATNRVCTL